MSTPANTPAPKRPRRRNKTILPVAAASVVAFLGLTGFLGAQMAGGNDPLVGSGNQATAQVQPATVKKVVITRKVIVKKDATPVASGTTAAASPAASYSAPPVQQSAPAQPAPAPAPVQSGTS